MSDAEQRRRRLAPALGLVAELLEVLLEREVGVLVAEARRHELGERLDHGQVGARVGVCRGEVGVEAPRHAGAGRGLALHGQLGSHGHGSVSCVRPPKGMSTVAAPMVESKRSERPLLEATFRSRTSEPRRSASVVPSQLGRQEVGASTCAFACLGAPLEERNSRDTSTIVLPRQLMRSLGSSVTCATTVASRFSSEA
jgi:hypothetical protein